MSNLYLTGTGYAPLQPTDMPSTVPFVPNGVSTVGNGFSLLTGVYDQVTQVASIAGGVISASLAVTGFYQLSGYLKKTTAATTSSTLGPLTLTYTDGTDSTVLTPTLALLTSTGTVATTNANNSVTVTGISSLVPFSFYGKAGSTVTFSLTYASSGTTAMAYEVHLRLELS